MRKARNLHSSHRSKAGGTPSSNIVSQLLLFPVAGALEEAFGVTFVVNATTGRCRCARRRIQPVDGAIVLPTAAKNGEGAGR